MHFFKIWISDVRTLPDKQRLGVSCQLLQSWKDPARECLGLWCNFLEHTHSAHEIVYVWKKRKRRMQRESFILVKPMMLTESGSWSFKRTKQVIHKKIYTLTFTQKAGGRRKWNSQLFHTKMQVAQLQNFRCVLKEWKGSERCFQILNKWHQDQFLLCYCWPPALCFWLVRAAAVRCDSCLCVRLRKVMQIATQSVAWRGWRYAKVKCWLVKKWILTIDSIKGQTVTSLTGLWSLRTSVFCQCWWDEEEWIWLWNSALTA